MSYSYRLHRLEPQWYLVDEPDIRFHRIGTRRWRVTAWKRRQQLQQAGFPVGKELDMAQAEAVNSVVAIIGGSGDLRQCSSWASDNTYAIGDTGYQLFRVHGKWRIRNDTRNTCNTRFATRTQALAYFQRWYEDPHQKQFVYVNMLTTYHHKSNNFVSGTSMP